MTLKSSASWATPSTSIFGGRPRPLSMCPGCKPQPNSAASAARDLPAGDDWYRGGNSGGAGSVAANLDPALRSETDRSAHDGRRGAAHGGGRRVGGLPSGAAGVQGRSHGGAPL